MSSISNRSFRAEFKKAMQVEEAFPAWVRRLGSYGLALLFVAAAAAVRWALPEVLGPVPFLIFYLAWVGAATFGGLGPGLLAAAASWLCVELWFDFTPGQSIFSSPAEVGRFTILLMGGLTVSFVAEGLRRGRMRQRQQIQQLADLTQLAGLGQLLIRDDQDRIVHWSEGCTRLYGFPVEQAIGRISHELLGTEFPQPLETIRAKLRETGRWEGELTHRRADGSVVHVASLWVLRDGGANSAVLEVNNDITERKRAEEALRESEQRYRTIGETIPYGVWLTDAAGHCTYVSDSFLELVGMTMEQVRQFGWLHLLPPEDVEPTTEHWLHCVRTGEPFEREHRFRTAEGDWRHVLAIGRPIRDEHGQITSWVGINLDITARKRAQEALRESEERFRAVFESTSDCILVWDRQYNYLYANQAAIDHVGTTRDQVIGKNMRDGLGHIPDFMHLWMGRVDRAFATGESFRVEDAVRVGDRLVHSESQVSPIRDAAGRVFAVSVVYRDVSDRKQVEEALRESELFYRQTLESIPGMVFTTRPDGYCDYQSQQWVDYTGVPMSEQLGDGWNKLLHPEDRPRAFAAWRAAVEGHAPYDLEYRVRRYDGQYEWFRVMGRPIRDAEGHIVRWFGVALNIEAIKQAEAELQRLNEDLEQRVKQRTEELFYRTRQLQRLTLELSETEDRERRRMAEILHDDLQQVLAAAKFHVGLLRNRTRYDASLQATAGQIDQMLRDAIEKSRSLSHELSPPVLHHDNVTETLRWLANQMQTKHGLTVQVRGNGDVHLESDAIKTLLYKTAQELLFNVVKHARVNEARVKVRQRGPCVCLSVSDRGRGFDPQELRRTAGYGLLSVRERIELIGGRMKVRSAEGKGSTFFVVVPVHEQVAARPPAEAVLPETKTAAQRGAGRLRVLLADDHEIVRQGLVCVLSEERTVEVVGEAANGREAVDLADQLHPDVVIMDVSMPVMSGDEATREIKSRAPDTRVIGLSMWEEPEVRERMHQAGAESYVLKTAPSEELLAAIRGKE